jgi:acetyltransferase-like isoleucine patch superfamily enzyme
MKRRLLPRLAARLGAFEIGARRSLCETAVLWLPGNRIGNPLKYLALRGAGAKVQWPVHIDSNVWIRNPREFECGPKAVISRGAVLNCSTTLRLGSGVLVGYGAFIGTAKHTVPPTLDETIVDAAQQSAPIHIGDDSWIGANACVLSGSELGSGSVVGAGTVVNGLLGPGDIVVGAPPRRVRVRG